jgi:prevent-host-death family protein
VIWSDDQFTWRYDEGMKNRLVSATEFKTHCLALLDEIDEQGGTITVTKRGRPVATVGPAKKQGWRSPRGVLAGKVVIVGDIINTDFWGRVRGN